MAEITCTRLTILTAMAVMIQMMGLSLFVFGFFPVKPALSGVSGSESFYPAGCDSTENRSQTETLLPPRQLKSIYQELSGIPPLFDRLILMVIDGLPAEFVLGKDDKPPSSDLMEAMPYTQSLLFSGMAVGYHTKAAPPTVTMPRLKAIVSGAIGGFLDVAFNFNTQALLDDNLLGQLFRIGWKMVMLGDETWIKLFPGLFMRQDGVSSFFVKDTVQVDQNVSRHLAAELNRDDWNLLTLHYLGLDHVGHLGGRNSLLMASKLWEMDEVVKKIHLSTIQNQDNDHRRTLLVVLSDHGMTENGNHGGSSYEETDALALFIGLENGISDYALATHNSVSQVDIAPTLALLFGVPIPKNNVGVLISEAFDCSTDDKKLRALELNSWQLLRLVQEQLPNLYCRNFPCNGSADGLTFSSAKCGSSAEEILYCLYMNASILHNSWKSNKASGEDFNGAVAAYIEFLKTASEWLSRRVTDKPVTLLSFAVLAMALSCLILGGLLICMDRDVFRGSGEKRHRNSSMCRFLNETFVVGILLVLVMSMGSSSMVEEEQYIWHFMISTFHLLLLRTVLQSFPVGSGLSSLKLWKGKTERNVVQLYSIFLLLISGRIMRGWHQGGVNWTNLPDVSKWLEGAGSQVIGLIQLASVILVMCLGLFSLSLFRSRRKFGQVIGVCFFMSGLLVLWHIAKYEDNAFASSGYGATALAQAIYATLVIVTIGTAIMVPWLMPIWISNTCSGHDVNLSTSVSTDDQHKSVLYVVGDSSYVIGLTYILNWCLLQLLLQQPINALLVFFLIIQILTTMLYYYCSGPRHKEWVEVAVLFYTGMAGHFALGNSNTLTTIDVAGAFIGISSYSTLLSGILMFIITYASPMLAQLSMMMYVSLKDTSYLPTPENVELGHPLKMILGFPCLVPLSLNSILLTAYTIVLLLMRNHLFIWSVFSPKYLYVCATTVCTYIGVFVVAATEVYVYFVIALRRKAQVPIVNDIK